jgi:hypothetical protein
METPEVHGTCYLAMEAAGIQSYIFDSNRLRENIGGSFLVAQATRDVPAARLEEGELVFAGGGALVAKFWSAERADVFERSMSVWALEHAPGLELVFARREAQGHNDEVGILRQLLRESLPAARDALIPSNALPAPPVTRRCTSTGRVATHEVRVGDDVLYLSSEAFAKHQAREPADSWLANYLDLPEGYSFPVELDQLGRSFGKMSYLGVVRLDGDAIGRVIATEFSSSHPSALSTFSTGLRNAVKAAATTLTAELARSVLSETIHPQPPWRSEPIRLRVADGRICLPFRPLVLSGDDITFVCDGRLALHLARRFSEEFGRNALQLAATPITASAGVAIVKSHYPFSRAYGMATQLLKNAKAYRKSLRGEGGEAPGACIDWHLEQGSLTDRLDALRHREYEVPSGALSLRPVTVGENLVEPGRSLASILGTVRGFLEVPDGPQEGWGGSRNKAKALRPAMREGPDAVNQLLIQTGLPLPPTPQESTGGWHGGKCLYFDALEIMDLHGEPAPAGGAS